MTRSRGVLVAATAGVVACFTAAAVPSAADAHAIVRPSASRPAELQQYTLTVPTERAVATVSIALKVPEGIDFFVVEKTPDWRTQLVRRNDRIDQVRWTGNSIPPGEFASFRFIARNPIIGTSVAWRVLQRYGDGKVVRWIGPPESEAPASTTVLDEQATPVDVVAGLNGGSAGGQSSGPSAAPAQSTDGGGSGRDALTLGLAAAALLLALGAIAAVALQLKRRPKT